MQLTARRGQRRAQSPQTLSPARFRPSPAQFHATSEVGVLFHSGDQRFLQAAWDWIGISTMSQNSVFETSETRLGHSLGHQGWGVPREDEALVVSLPLSLINRRGKLARGDEVGG